MSTSNSLHHSSQQGSYFPVIVAHHQEPFQHIHSPTNDSSALDLDLELEDSLTSASSSPPLTQSSPSHLPPGHNMSTAPDKITLTLGHLPSRKEIPPSGPRTPSRIDPNNPPWPAFRGYHEFSFAHATMGVRLPTILGKAIEDVVKTLNSQWEVDRIEDLVECTKRMDELMENLSANQFVFPSNRQFFVLFLTRM